MTTPINTNPRKSTKNFTGTGSLVDSDEHQIWHGVRLIER